MHSKDSCAMKRHPSWGSLVLIVPAAFVAYVGFPPWASAYQVTPLSTVLKQSGTGASATFEVTNRSEAPLPVEVSIHNRIQDLEGNDIPDKSTTAEEKFVIF